MTKAEVIKSIEYDLAKAKAMAEKHTDSHAESALSLTMYYEGQMLGLQLALITLQYLED